MMNYGEIDFQQTIKKGKSGELIFKDDFLDFLGIKYIDVTGCQRFQVLDTDYMTKIGSYEIKTNYRDNREIIIEEYTNHNQKLGKISLGWFYKSKADLLIFISKTSRTMVFLPFTSLFKEAYENIKNDHQLKRNKISVYNGRKWQSAFRVIPLKSITGFYSLYKKLI